MKSRTRGRAAMMADEARSTDQQRRRARPSANARGGSAGWWGPTRINGRRLSAAVKLVVGVCLMATGVGCRQDMHDQPKYRPLRESRFFANTSSARLPVEGTIARGTLQTDAAFFTGKNGALFVNELPFPATEAVLNRGQERFNIYCSPCHGQTGAGNGLVVQRGYPTPPSFHIDRLRNIEAGYFFDVMTNGFGRMPDYRAQIAPRDRWNVVAYIRALQLASHATKADLPEGVTDPAEAQKKAAEATAKPSGHQ